MSCKSVTLLVILALVSEGLCYAQHPGAYSSPHYAKKPIHYSQHYNQPTPPPYSEPDYQKLSPAEYAEKSKHQEIDIPDFSEQRREQQNHSAQDQIPAPSRAAAYPAVENNSLAEVPGDAQAGRSFASGAGSFLSGRGGQMLADLARELIARSTGASSQVLSLNLTNLVILVVLKALILAAGMFGAGAWNHGYGRSLEKENNSLWIGEEELSLWKGYLRGGDMACLAHSACKYPTLAKRYSSGADILLTTAKLLEGTVPYDAKYESIVEEVKEAATWGAAGMQCDARYNKCIA